MQELNILNQYKNTLGEYCAINQFVELANRCFVTEHNAEINNRDSLVSLATRYSLTLTNYDYTEMIRLVSRSYIVNVHLCFETFLKNLCSSVRKYGDITFIDRIQGESWLSCAIRNIVNNKLPKEKEALVKLCEYYRLIRNSSVHDLCDIDKHTTEYSALNKYNFKNDAKFEGLSAPNTFDNISYDDFIMFACTTIELATYLFNGVEYDYTKIVKCIPKTVQSNWQTYKKARLEKAIYTYIKTNFKVNESLETQLPDLAAMLTTQ